MRQSKHSYWIDGVSEKQPDIVFDFRRKKLKELNKKQAKNLRKWLSEVEKYFRCFRDEIKTVINEREKNTA